MQALIPKRRLHACLDLLVADHQAALFIPRYQHHSFFRSRVHLSEESCSNNGLGQRRIRTTDLVQAVQNMTHIGDRVTMFVHLVKDVIAE